MNPDACPHVSFIVPVLNAAGVLENCLRSIAQQDYPPEQCEILLADGGSSDATREIAARYRAKVLDNPLRIAEEGKRLALGQALGDFIVFMDADNELTHPDFLALAIRALQRYPQALGVESYYPATPRMGSFCAFLTATLHISDPISWIMSVPPTLLGVDGEVERWTFTAGRLAYPLGANGFVYRRADLEAARCEAQFEDTQVALKLALSGKTEWLRLSGRGVHHYVVKGLWDFVRKRRRQTYHFMRLRKRGGLSWTGMKPRVSSAVACIYCATLLGPLWHALRGLMVSGDRRWVWHPVACIASVAGLGWGVLTWRFSPNTADAEAGLQPVQNVP